MRERRPQQTYAIGFSTYDGTVTAAAEWDGPARKRRVLPGLPGSYEELLHEASAVAETDILLPLHGDNAAIEALMEPRLQRAIGVIYKPETERFSHYPTPSCRGSSTACCTWIERPPCSPSTVTRGTKNPTKSRRPGRLACNTRGSG